MGGKKKRKWLSLFPKTCLQTPSCPQVTIGDTSVPGGSAQRACCLKRQNAGNINTAHTGDVKQKSKEMLEETSGRTVNGTSSLFMDLYGDHCFFLSYSHIFLWKFFVVVTGFVLLQILKFIPNTKVHNQLIWFLFPGGKFMDSETNKDNKFSAALKNCPKEANSTPLKWTANSAICYFVYSTPTCGVFSWPTHLEPR